jgi:hypothetical protein
VEGTGTWWLVNDQEIDCLGELTQARVDGIAASDCGTAEGEVPAEDDEGNKSTEEESVYTVLKRTGNTDDGGWHCFTDNRSAEIAGRAWNVRGVNEITEQD